MAHDVEGVAVDSLLFTSRNVEKFHSHIAAAKGDIEHTFPKAGTCEAITDDKGTPCTNGAVAKSSGANYYDIYFIKGHV